MNNQQKKYIGNLGLDHNEVSEDFFDCFAKLTRENQHSRRFS